MRDVRRLKKFPLGGLFNHCNGRDVTDLDQCDYTVLCYANVPIKTVFAMNIEQFFRKEVQYFAVWERLIIAYGSCDRFLGR